MPRNDPMPPYDLQKRTISNSSSDTMQKSTCLLQQTALIVSLLLIRNLSICKVLTMSLGPKPGLRMMRKSISPCTVFQGRGTQGSALWQRFLSLCRISGMMVIYSSLVSFQTPSNVSPPIVYINRTLSAANKNPILLYSGEDKILIDLDRFGQIVDNWAVWVSAGSAFVMIIMSSSRLSINNRKAISPKKPLPPLQTHTFTLYYQRQELASLALPSNATVGDLNLAAKRMLESRKFQQANFLCLQSMQDEEVLDYALLDDEFKIERLREGEQLNIIFKEPVTTEKWVSLNDFQFKKCLGQGASASVYLVRHKATGKLYALKQIQKSYFVEFKRMEQVLREKKIMCEFVTDLPFTVKLYASFESLQHLNFLLEFYPGGEMFYHLQQRRLTEAEARLYFAEMVLTFEHLHKKEIIYRDLKPENIMIDAKGHARLTDFGLCKINISKDDLTTSYCGSLEYMAPEVKENAGYNFSVDFYTLGAFLYEMVIGTPPFYNDQPLKFLQSSSQEFKQLVKGLISEQLDKRIMSFSLIKNHKWMADLDWAKLKNKEYPMPLKIDPHATYIHEQFRKVKITNNYHSEKYDRLFEFFNFIKIDESNFQFNRCYGNSSKSRQSFTSPLGDGMKKDKKNKSQSNRSKKKTSVEKSGNSSREKEKVEKNNIYLKKTREDSQNKTLDRSGSGVIFQKLKHSKSGELGLKLGRC